MLTLSQLFGMRATITCYPFVFHSLAQSVFSSVIGPFGGFFASGFKRAFKIKVIINIILLLELYSSFYYFIDYVRCLIALGPIKICILRFQLQNKTNERYFVTQDFGDVIPGHGGFLDRFDCQILMATFVNVYITSFIRTASPQKLLQQVLLY